MFNSDPSHREDSQERAWARSGFDAVGLLVAAFFAVVVEGFFIGPSWPFAVEISSGIMAGVIAILVLTRKFWKSKRVSLSWVVYRAASGTVGMLAGIEVKLVLAMSWPAGVVSTVILLAVVTWVVRQQRLARKRLTQQRGETRSVT